MSHQAVESYREGLLIAGGAATRSARVSAELMRGTPIVATEGTSPREEGVQYYSGSGGLVVLLTRSLVLCHDLFVLMVFVCLIPQRPQEISTLAPPHEAEIEMQETSRK